MYLIASFGFLMVLICAYMALNPKPFSEGIVLFSEKSWFHLFEILSRAIMGFIFVAFSSSTLYPSLFKLLGFALMLVAVGLIFLAPKRHKNFALWAAKKFEKRFRVIGIISMPIGGLIIYMALSGN